jgi:putative FmdB family regulatory protein
MPTYDYVCKGCGHRSERFESINDGGPKKCLKCGKKKARRMLGTGAGLIFKGSGFYTTDSKSSPGKGDAGGGSKDGEMSKDAEKSKDGEKKPAAADKKDKPDKTGKKEEKEQKK